jgi:hypothetical protein
MKMRELGEEEGREGGRKREREREHIEINIRIEGRRAMAGGVIKRKHLSNILKAAGRALGESMEGFGPHSLRIGGATALHMQGMADSWIMWFGNWSSPTYLIYCWASSSMYLDFSEKMASADVRVQQGDVDEQALRQSIPLYGGRKAF